MTWIVKEIVIMAFAVLAMSFINAAALYQFTKHASTTSWPRQYFY